MKKLIGILLLISSMSAYETYNEDLGSSSNLSK